MYVPASFAEHDREKLHEFIQRHSFATLVTSGQDEPFATHLPLLLDVAGGDRDGRLVGHFARANPHWKVAADSRVLAVFHGPHAYISPGWIDVRNVVPTWNYIAVHAYGVLRVTEDRAKLREIVERTVIAYESKRENPWSLDRPDDDYVEQLLGGIVGFEIVIDRLEGKWKLSQNHVVERRRQIVEGLQATQGHDENAIAEVMRVSLE